ncbi:MAG: thiamine phosphate synthase, partial [Methylophilaceae bacterium]
RHVHELSSDFGIHFTESDLFKQTQVNPNKINSASVHSLKSIQYAQKLGINFVVLSHVYETKSHPLAKGMGWNAFKTIVNQVDIPVYALGGMSLDDLDLSYNNGAVGIASQRKIWDLLN